MSRLSKFLVFHTLGGGIIFSSKIIEPLLAIGPSFFADVQDFSSQRPLPFYELRAEAVLPPFGSSTTGFERERPCEKCHRDGYFEIPHVPLRIVYPHLDETLRQKNVLATFECFGNSKLRIPLEDSVYARPLILVSNRVADVMRKIEIPGIILEHVCFECEKEEICGEG